MSSFEENAESECERVLNLALQLNSSSLDVKQTFVSLRISQNRKAEAAELILSVCNEVLDVRKRHQEKCIIDELKREEGQLEEIPNIDFCMSTLKLLLEVAADDNQLGNVSVMCICDSFIRTRKQ